MKVLKELKLFDQDLLFGQYGVNYDDKHLVKRLRSLVISQKRDIKLINVKLNRFSLGILFYIILFVTLISLFIIYLFYVNFVKVIL